jgi:hypothetical protein
MPLHLYEVGKPYHAGRKVWPETAQLHWMSGELELTVFMDRPTRHEVEAVRRGRSEFALYSEADLIVLCYRFEGKRANIPWSDASYQWHLVPPAERVMPADPAGLTPESRVPLHVVLVNAIGGLIEAMRVVTLSPELTRALFAAIRSQAAAPWDREAHDRALVDLYRTHTSDRLAAAAPVRCQGGT